VSVNSLSERILTELHSIHGDVPADADELAEAQAPDADEEVDALMAGLSDDELRELLGELEATGDHEGGENRQ